MFAGGWLGCARRQCAVILVSDAARKRRRPIGEGEGAIGALVLLSAWALITPALAQTYPERAVIVPQPPGGGFDTVARVLADRLSPLLGQPLLVDPGRSLGRKAIAAGGLRRC
jgi:hypothetical protein